MIINIHRILLPSWSRWLRVQKINIFGWLTKLSLRLSSASTSNQIHHSLFNYWLSYRNWWIIKMRIWLTYFQDLCRVRKNQVDRIQWIRVRVYFLMKNEKVLKSLMKFRYDRRVIMDRSLHLRRKWIVHCLLSFFPDTSLTLRFKRSYYILKICALATYWKDYLHSLVIRIPDVM